MNLHSKKDFQDCMLSILEPLKLYYSEEKARLTLGVTMAHYDIGATWMEAFSRPLWGLVPFWAGGGKEPEFEEIYRKGLTAEQIIGRAADGMRAMRFDRVASPSESLDAYLAALEQAGPLKSLLARRMMFGQR